MQSELPAPVRTHWVGLDKGRYHGNHFLASIGLELLFGCVIAWDYISCTYCLILARGRFTGSSYLMKTAEIEGLRDVAIATAFRTTLYETGDNDMGISYKRWLAFVQPLRLLVALSLSLFGFVVVAVGLGTIDI